MPQIDATHVVVVSQNGYMGHFYITVDAEDDPATELTWVVKGMTSDGVLIVPLAEQRVVVLSAHAGAITFGVKPYDDSVFAAK